MAQQQIDYGAAYPSRPPMFARTFNRTLLKSCATYQVGDCGFKLLILISETEDAKRYSEAVFFTDNQIRPMIGTTEKTLVKARRACVEKGWLHFEPAHLGEPSRYWVKIPTKYSNLGRELGDDETQWRNSTTMGTETGTETGTRMGTKTSPSLRTNPKPIPSSSCKEGEEWEAVENEMLNQGIGSPAEALRSLQATRCPPGLALDVLRHASEAQLWSAGRVRRRLLNLRPGQDPLDRRLWMQPDQGPARPATSAGAADSDRARLDRLRQLELDFEPKLKGITIEKIILRYALPEAIASRLRPWSSQPWSRGLRMSDSTRLELLEHLAAK